MKGDDVESVIDADAEERIKWIVRKLDQTIRNAEDKCTIVQSKNGESVEKPTPDYRSVLVALQMIAQLWGLLGNGNRRKSAEGEAGEADDDKLADLSDAMGE